ncbi:MAG: hypothetical protein AMS26_20385 [Bacteroides sp. SM23_62]|nr:MAG: hypothetical protein AMS26_20385 [Bacteroides sp. SM23_62]
MNSKTIDMNRTIIKHTITFITAFLLPGMTPLMLAQDEIDKEIVVVKPYEPSLSDAFKINVLPSVSDSISIRPDFNYIIEPKKFETAFHVRPISPAKLVGVPLKKLYKSYLKIGIGNYLIPLGELRVNSLRSKKSQWGLSLRHYSINGKIKLDNDQKVSPGYFENSGNLYGKKIFNKAYLAGDLKGAWDGANFYGYHASLDTSLNEDDVKQRYLKLDGRLKMGSIHKDSAHVNYTWSLDYNYTGDRFKNNEHAFLLNANVNKRFRSGNTLGLGLSGKYYRPSLSIDSINNTVVSAKPWIGKATADFSYRVGVEVLADIRGDDVAPHFYPDAYLQIGVVRGILVPYLGAGGKLQVNNHRPVVEENRYITPGLKVANTSHNLRAYVGLKGSLSRAVSYDISASYSMISKMPFFINDTTSVLGNTFTVTYDDLRLTRIRGELLIQQSDRLSFLLLGRYDQYDLDNLEKPWHKPEITASFATEYNLRNKILLDASLNYMGQRFAPATALDNEMITLKGFVDLNMGVEYRYTKLLSGFLRLNNILGARNYFWNQYPAIGFNVMAGFTYAL